MQIQPVRRVVTGHDDDGRAVVVQDGFVAAVFHRKGRPVALTDLWSMDEVPTQTGSTDPLAEQDAFVLPPPEGGVRFRIVQFNPELPDTYTRTDGDDVFAEMGTDQAHVAGARHPFMHRTPTVDFGIVLSGRITMVLDDSEVEVKAGDVVIQRGTNHAWANRSDQPCTVAFVLVDADK